MNSLSELNTASNQSLDYIDSRPAGVVFLRKYPLLPIDQEITVSSTTVTPDVGDEIVEIINYQTANVRYQITINSSSSTFKAASSISWATLPSGVSFSVANNVYTLTGLKTVADWNQVKNFTWTVPTEYATFPLWFLTVSIVYYDEALGEEITHDWEVRDPRFYKVAELNSISTIVAIGGNNSPASVDLLSVSTIYADLWNKVYASVSAASVSTVYCVSEKNAVNIDMKSVSTMTTSSKYRASGSMALASAATIFNDLSNSVTNLIARTYLANTANNIFATNTPQVNSSNSADTFSITISSSLGQFGIGASGTPASSVTISGTKSVVNAALTGSGAIRFYPTKGSTSSGTFTWAQSRNGVLEFTRNIGLTGYANAFTPATYTFTSSTTWTPTVVEQVYGLADVLLVAAGGGGGYYGSGGGAGGFKELTNQSLSGSYTLTIGAAGGGGYNVLTVGKTEPTNGGNLVAFGQTVQGGSKGKNGQYTLENYPADYPTQPYVYRWNNPGGASGTPTAHAGGTYSGIAFTSSGIAVKSNTGAGGGGAATVGSNGVYATVVSGGSGVTSTILSGTFSVGGSGSSGSNLGSAGANYGCGGNAGNQPNMLNTGSAVDIQGGSGVVVIKIHA